MPLRPETLEMFASQKKLIGIMLKVRETHAPMLTLIKSALFQSQATSNMFLASDCYCYSVGCYWLNL